MKQIQALLKLSEQKKRSSEKPLAFIERISSGQCSVRELSKEFSVPERTIRLWCSTREDWIRTGVRSVLLKKVGNRVETINNI